MNDEIDGAAIEVQSLRKVYAGGVEAVRGIDFTVSRGEVFGLLGPNGAGKSTTIGILTTTVRPTGGAARVAGHDVVREPLAARAASSVVFQDQVLDLTLTGRRNVEIHSRLWNVGGAARIDELSATLGISDIIDRPVAIYSGGQRRRLEIARALVSDPQVLFLDEPTVGLDPRIRHELIDVIAGLRSTGMTILLTTHYLDEAERLCDRVAIMHEGEIVALDTPPALLASLGHEVVELRVRGDGSHALSMLRGRGIADDAAFVVGGTVTLPMRNGDAPEVVAAIRGMSLDITALATRQPSLDDVYLRLTGNTFAGAA
ncbi:MAG: ATP-binding cassette domain-containing protein [Candidatus Dormibacteraeota bacterium]|nr:ATP-binding cassette domain-containing protein [Candidatus Dormibacteraeota bacterium]MBV8445792.1 ATP-binding cassette domain-containing protein [Candidatus Dormibacteraeota bacterium]